MTAFWISLALAVVLGLATWRLRRASRLVDQILEEERERSGHAVAPTTDDGAEPRHPHQ